MEHHKCVFFSFKLICSVKAKKCWDIFLKIQLPFFPKDFTSWRLRIFMKNQSKIRKNFSNRKSDSRDIAENGKSESCYILLLMSNILRNFFKKDLYTISLLKNVKCWSFFFQWMIKPEVHILIIAKQAV